jgi:hypothetical protein
VPKKDVEENSHKKAIETPSVFKIHPTPIPRTIPTTRVMRIAAVK